MKLYKTRYFDTVNWDWIEQKFIAPDKESVLELINKNCPEEYRQRYLSAKSTEPIDSLSIEEILELTGVINLNDLISSY